MTTTNFFSNQDPDLPNLKSLKLPKIKKGLPKIQMTKDSDLLVPLGHPFRANPSARTGTDRPGNHRENH